MGIVAACLSNMRPLFKFMHVKIWTRYVGSAAHSSQQTIVVEQEKHEWPRNTPSPNGTTGTLK